jgi:hypothetical protein
MSWKKALEEGRGWDLAGAKLHRVHQRTPDGYFLGRLADRNYSFVLEYEHTPYNRDKMTALVLNLTRDFPNAFRLIVSRDKEHAVRLAHGLESFLKGDPQCLTLWGFSFYEKVSGIPLTRVPWVNLKGGYLSFVKDPILTTGNPEDEPGKATA